MVYVYASILTILNLAFLAGILIGLPGTWLMLLSAVAVDWLQPGEPMFSAAALWLSAGLAMLGEIFEFAFAAAGSSRAGGSKRAAALAIVGGLVGAVFGTLIPLPILGTLIGASLGAFGGSLLGDLWAGRPVRRSVEAGHGAAVGRFWGTVAKTIIGAAIIVILAVGAFT